MKQFAKDSIKKENTIVVLIQRISIISIVIFHLPVLFFIFVLSFFNTYFVLLILLCVPILGLSYEYVIEKSFSNKIVFKTFNFSFFSRKKLILYPGYISLVHQIYKDGTGWSWFPAVFGDAKFKLYTIKFFKGKEHQTVFKTPNKEDAIQKANELSELLNVRIHNTLKT